MLFREYMFSIDVKIFDDYFLSEAGWIYRWWTCGSRATTRQLSRTLKSLTKPCPVSRLRDCHSDCQVYETHSRRTLLKPLARFLGEVTKGSEWDARDERRKDCHAFTVLPACFQNNEGFRSLARSRTLAVLVSQPRPMSLRLFLLFCIQVKGPTIRLWKKSNNRVFLG